MFDQRIQQFSTILVAATIMMAALVVAAIQGVLPSWKDCRTSVCESKTRSSSDIFITVVYSISTSLSLASLFISVVLCIEVIWLASTFMHRRSRLHRTHLKDALDKTKSILCDIRTAKDTALEISDKSDENRDSMGSTYGGGSILDPDNSSKPKRTSRRRLSLMEYDCINEEFEVHEPVIQDSLEKSDEIVRMAAFRVSANPDGPSDQVSFEIFWSMTCEGFGIASIFFFYSGSYFLFFCYACFMWSNYIYDYDNPTGGKLAVVILMISVLATCLLIFYMRFEDFRLVDSEYDLAEVPEENYGLGNPVTDIISSGKSNPFNSDARERFKSAVKKVIKMIRNREHFDTNWDVHSSHEAPHPSLRVPSQRMSLSMRNIRMVSETESSRNTDSNRDSHTYKSNNSNLRGVMAADIGDLNTRDAKFGLENSVESNRSNNEDLIERIGLILDSPGTVGGGSVFNQPIVLGVPTTPVATEITVPIASSILFAASAVSANSPGPSDLLRSSSTPLSASAGVRTSLKLI